MSVLHAEDATQVPFTALAGARVRIFVVSNAAITGSLGAGWLLQENNGAFIVGARPLGSAGFVYYFR